MSPSRCDQRGCRPVKCLGAWVERELGVGEKGPATMFRTWRLKENCEKRLERSEKTLRIHFGFTQIFTQGLRQLHRANAALPKIPPSNATDHEGRVELRLRARRRAVARAAAELVRCSGAVCGRVQAG